MPSLHRFLCGACTKPLGSRNQGLEKAPPAFSRSGCLYLWIFVGSRLGNFQNDGKLSMPLAGARSEESLEPVPGAEHSKTIVPVGPDLPAYLVSSCDGRGERMSSLMALPYSHSREASVSLYSLSKPIGTRRGDGLGSIDRTMPNTASAGLCDIL